MKIEKIYITIKDLAEGYINDTETNIENGVYAYNGKLCVRPAFQRSFVYNKKQENAVIDTALKGFPLNIMYWVDNEDGTYDCLDGQQRTISLCNFMDGTSSFLAKWLGNGENHYYLHTLKRTNKELYDSFLNYKLEIYICHGTKAEQMEWFKTINIAGEELYPQELRNINYVSPWLSNAKKYFSKASGTATCPAERIGNKYTNKNANRQEILEQVISWICDSDKDEDICNYMEAHINDPDATELWNYYNEVINWVKDLFPEIEDNAMKTVNWGFLYNHYKNQEFDSDEINNKYYELMEYRASKELSISPAKILEYCITRDDSLLRPRTFSEAQKITMYNNQKGICPDCHNKFDRKEMHAHHIIPWYSGGVTETSNGVMICKSCHTKRHANS